MAAVSMCTSLVAANNAVLGAGAPSLARGPALQMTPALPLRMAL